MKKVLQITIIIISAVLFYSCEEDFNPGTDFREKYILNCIIRGDTAYHIATIKKNYKGEIFNPYADKEIDDVKNAYIRIWYDDKVYTFRDTMIAREDTSRYTEPVYYYYSKDFIPESGKLLELRAELPNNKVLSGTTITPSEIQRDITTGVLLPNGDNEYSSVGWISKDERLYYAANFKFYYKKYVGGGRYQFEKKVPLDYKIVDGKEVPVYSLIFKAPKVIIRNSILDEMMKEISANDFRKKDYTIMGGVFEIMILDENLSTYYSSTHDFSDGFSINVDESDFTNITGGYGIFGSTIKRKVFVGFNKDYITSFGYETLQ